MRLVRPDQNTRQRPCPVRRHGVRAHRPALSVKNCNILDMYELIGLLEDDHLLNMVRVVRERLCPAAHPVPQIFLTLCLPDAVAVKYATAPFLRCIFVTFGQVRARQAGQRAVQNAAR